MPLYERTKITDDLHDKCGFSTDFRFITKQKMKNIEKISRQINYPVCWLCFKILKDKVRPYLVYDLRSLLLFLLLKRISASRLGNKINFW